MTCSICNQTFQGLGNNAHPIKNVRCCDDCNTKIIQTRIKLFIQSIASTKEAK